MPSTITHYEMANAVCEAASAAVEIAENVKHGRMIVDQDQQQAIQQRAERLEAAHHVLRSLDRLQRSNDQARKRTVAA